MATKKPRGEQDSVWKEIITDYFREFMEFFYPLTAARIDWRKKPQFLDAELQKLTRRSERKKRLADKLVQVQLNDGSQQILLVHIEVQSYADADFAERMFTYYYRIIDRYKQRVISLALLTDPSAENVTSLHEVKEANFHLRFEFPLVKLWEYGKTEEELQEGNNPFALIVLMHLRKLAAQNVQQKFDAKLELGKMLYDKGYIEQDVIKLYRFLDWLIMLPEKKEELLAANLKEYEETRRQTMAYITSAERIGMKKGRQEGLQEGLQEGRRNTLLEVISRLAERRFGALETTSLTHLESLSIERLEELVVKILDFADKKELESWLEQYGLTQAQK